MTQTVMDVLASVSRELDSLADLSTALQNQLSPQSCAGFEVEGLQGLDTLTQTLRCLAAFLARLPSATPCNCPVAAGGALAEISLSGLARRLDGVAGDDAGHDRCDLF